MNRSISISLALLITTTLYSQDFQQGYYIDYADEIHQGYIKIKKRDGGFRFKTSLNEKSSRVSTKEARFFIMGSRQFFMKSFSTFAEQWENYRGVDNGNSFIEKSSFFVELIEQGTICVYAHSDLEFTGITPRRDLELYIEKGTMVNKMTSNGSYLPQRIFGILEKYLADDQVFLEMYKSKVYRDGDWFTLVKDYNNKHRNFTPKSDTLTIYRTKRKEREEPIIISNASRQWEIRPNTLVNIIIDDITDFELCLDGYNCRELSGSLIRKNYLEASFSITDDKPEINYVDYETSEYNVNRIQFLMKKSERKSSK